MPLVDMGDVFGDAEVGSGAGSGENISFLDELFVAMDGLLTELDATEENTTMSPAVDNANVEYVALPSCEEFLLVFFVFICVCIFVMYLLAALIDLYYYCRN